MKAKLLALTIVALMIVSGIALVGADKPEDKPDKSGGANEIDVNGPHYNLNIIGKKANWNGNPGNNLDRHTMFVPEDTTGWKIELPAVDDPQLPIEEYPDDWYVKEGIAIWMSQGPEFAMLDCNAFDDGECSFQLGPGKYRVFICAKAKPSDDYYTDITGWVYAHDYVYGHYYLYDVGDIQVKGKKWNEATDLFYISPGEDIFEIIGDEMWIFEYLTFLKNYDFEFDPNNPGIDIDEALYFWQFDNHGNKLVKLRFYKN